MPDYKNKRGFDFIDFLRLASIKAVQHKETQLPIRVIEFFLFFGCWSWWDFEPHELRSMT